MTIKVWIVADSVNIYGDRATTFLLTMPRFLLAQLNTHRVLSKSTSSSRAIPLSKTLCEVWSDPATPIHWGRNKSKMQATEELTGWRLAAVKVLWRASSFTQWGFVKLLSLLGLHKQVANRLLEPFLHVQVLVTGTEWGNFFNLRVSEHAQPEFRQLASRMFLAYLESKPVLKQPGEWHLPFGQRFLQEVWSVEELVKIATGRAARTSYANFQGDINPRDDIRLHDDLVREHHSSPTEHCCRAMDESRPSGNFVGFEQYRKMLPGENQREMELERLKEVATKYA